MAVLATNSDAEKMNAKETGGPSKAELEWINLTQEIRAGHVSDESRLMRKLKENPFVPLGCLATTAVLSYGIYSFSKGRTRTSQKMMRWRVVAQGLTLFAIVAGVVYNAPK